MQEEQTMQDKISGSKKRGLNPALDYIWIRVDARDILLVTVRNDGLVPRGKLSTCFEKRLEDRIWVVEIVVDDVDEIGRVHDVGDELSRR